MAQVRQTYLLKLTCDEVGQLQIELKPTDRSPPRFFSSLRELTRHLEKSIQEKPAPTHPE
jgi:hypothetical protein